jgi:hypothetical protein
MSGSANAGQNVILFMALVCAAVCGSSPALSITYYVSCTGNDADTGTGTSTPWATSSKASSQAYPPGDQVQLQDGGRYLPTCDIRISGQPNYSFQLRHGRTPPDRRKYCASNLPVEYHMFVPRSHPITTTHQNRAWTTYFTVQ